MKPDTGWMLTLSIRTANRLTHAGLDTKEQVRAWSDHDLLKLRGAGQRVLCELRAAGLRPDSCIPGCQQPAGHVGDHAMYVPVPKRGQFSKWHPAAAYRAHDTVAKHVVQAIPDAKVATDRELLRRALLALTPDPGETAPRWSLVRNALGHGSTVGHHICVAVGIDPDEQVKGLLPLCNGRWEDKDWKPSPDGDYFRSAVTEDGKWDGQEWGHIIPRRLAADTLFVAEIGRITFKTRAEAKKWVEAVARLHACSGAL